MPDLQRYPWNHNLIKNVEDNFVLLTQKMFISVNFSIVSYKQEGFLEIMGTIPSI